LNHEAHEEHEEIKKKIHHKDTEDTEERLFDCTHLQALVMLHKQ